MNYCAALGFRRRLKLLHKDMNKIRQELRLFKRNPESVDRDILWKKILETDQKVICIEKELKEQKEKEKIIDQLSITQSVI